MSSILEEDEDGSAGGSSSCSSDSEDDAEFVPSAWNSQATPSRSALRSPDKKVVGIYYLLLTLLALSQRLRFKGSFVFVCCKQEVIHAVVSNEYLPN